MIRVPFIDRAFSFLRFPFCRADGLNVTTTTFTARVPVFVDDGQVLLGWDGFAAAHTGRAVPGAVTLDHFGGFDACCGFKTVDVLGVIR